MQSAHKLQMLQKSSCCIFPFFLFLSLLFHFGVGEPVHGHFPKNDQKMTVYTWKRKTAGEVVSEMGAAGGFSSICGIISQIPEVCFRHTFHKKVPFAPSIFYMEGAKDTFFLLLGGQRHIML